MASKSELRARIAELEAELAAERLNRTGSCTVPGTGCTCFRAWNSILPPPPCAVHNKVWQTLPAWPSSSGTYFLVDGTVGQ